MALSGTGWSLTTTGRRQLQNGSSGSQPHIVIVIVVAVIVVVVVVLFGMSVLPFAVGTGVVPL